MANPSYKIDDVAISETSNGSLTVTVWKASGYEETYQLPADRARFLFNRLGAALGRLPEDDTEAKRAEA